MMRTKKRRRRLASLALSLLFALSCVMTGITANAAAGTAGRDGLEAVLETSKSAYQAEEKVDVTLTVTNAGNSNIENIRTVLHVPDGMKTESGELSPAGFSLGAGESKKGETVLFSLTQSSGGETGGETGGESSGETDGGNSSDNANAPQQGETVISPQTGDAAAPFLWGALMILSGLGLIYIYNKKLGKRLFSLMTAIAIGLTLVPSTVAEAAESKNFSVSVQISVGEKAVTVTADIYYEEAAAEESAFTVYVAPEGNDANPGTLENPVKTLERARNIVREGNTDKLPVTVYLRGGEYILSKTFELTGEDGGTKEAPVVYRAYEDEEVIISGSKAYDLGAFRPVEGEMKELLPTEEAKNHVLVADASELGLNPIVIGITGSTYTLDAPLMMLDSHNMNLTRYPNSLSNEDWVMAEAVSPSLTTDSYPAVKIGDEEVLSWNYNAEDYIYFGYFAYGWGGSYVKGTIDHETRILSATTPANLGSSYGTKPIQIYNSYETIDEPGEWYYDTNTDKLYLYPYEDTTADSKLYITQSRYDLISIRNAGYISLEGITVTSSAKSGIVMDQVDSCVVNNCKAVNFLGMAISIDNANNSGVKNSDIAYTASTSVYVDGGDWETLTPGNNFISNNRIHDTNRNRTFNEGGIEIRGVAGTVDHNEFYNIPEQAMNFALAGDTETSVYTVIEYNVFHECNINGKDYSVIYAGRDARCQGAVIRYNYFYNLGNSCTVYDMDAAAVYLDDGLSGATVTNNIFGPGSSSRMEAVRINNGHNNIVTNNLLIDVPSMFYAAIPDNFEERYLTENGFGLRWSSAAVLANELYRQTWPWIQKAYEGSRDFYINNVISDNVLIYIDAKPNTVYSNSPENDNWFYAGGKNERVDDLDSNLVIFRDANADNRSQFVDYANGDYRLTDEVLAQTEFQNIDQSQIGLKPFLYDGKERMPGGNKPVVYDISFSQAPVKGAQIEAIYRFEDADGDQDAATFANFYLSDSAEESFYLHLEKVSDNTTGKKFTVTDYCEGKWIRCKVTPVDSSGLEGEPVWSDPVYVELSAPVDKTQLQELVNRANELLANAVIGEEAGQWSEKEASLLRTAVEAAQAVLDKENASQYLVEEKIAELTAAIERFLNNQNGGGVTNIISIDEMLADEENWVMPGTTVPTFAQGSLNIASTLGDGSVSQMIGYNAQTYSNKLFSFKFKVDYLGDTDGRWSGIYLQSAPSSYPWNEKGLLVVMKDTQIELQFRGEKTTVLTAEGAYLKPGQEQEMIFGMYDENSTDVRAILSIDGVELFNEVVTDSVLLSSENYFGAFASDGGVSLTLIGNHRMIDVNSMIADEANWAALEGSTTTFQNGQLNIASALGDGSKHNMISYTGKTYANEVFSLDFKVDFLGDTAGCWAGVYLQSAPVSYPWNEKGILVVMKDTQIELQFRGEKTTVLTAEGAYLRPGEQQKMILGMYDENSTDVRVILSIDGVELFNEIVTDSVLLSSENYFGVFASNGGVSLTLGSTE